jgi:hypothetical protein
LRRRQAFANVRHVNFSPLLALAGLGTIGLLATRLPRLQWPHTPSLELVLAAGAPLVLAGLVLGPGIDLLTRPVLDALAPVTALAIGWIGAALGARFEWRHVQRIPRATWLLAGLSATAAFAAVLLGAWLLARAVPALSGAWTPRLPAILTLAAVAAASGPGAVALVARVVGVRHRMVRLLARTATLQTAYGALAASIPLALYHPDPLLSWTVWGIGGGALTGLVFLSLTRLSPEQTGTGFALLASLLFGAGIAYAAGVSPFIVGALATALIVHGSPQRHVVRQVLWQWERPVAAILLIVAGALLAVPTPWILVAVPLLMALRAGAAWAAIRAGRRLPVEGVAQFPPHIGLGTMAQGVAAVALGLSFLMVFGGRGAGVLTTIVLSVATAQIAAPALMKRALGATPAGPAAPAVPEPLTRAGAAPEVSVNAPAELTR